MILMVVGGGGREHALIKKLSENPQVEKIYALPGNAGIGADIGKAECVAIKATDLNAICHFAQARHIDFAVVAPDDPLALGLVDRLAVLGIMSFGPTGRAAMIESSKAWAKALMQKYQIPTAAYAVFSDAAAALAYVRRQSYPLVLKADGLALGKGVFIAADQAEAEQAVDQLMNQGKFGPAGAKIVIEEYLTGPEVSVLAFTDGKIVKPLVSAMDHKQAYDGGRGPNTGGMGAVAPNPYYTPEIASLCMERIFQPTIAAMAAEGRPFRGCLYFGLMLTAAGPKVIEYNCRFGDPETQAVLPLLETDLLAVMEACSRGRLQDLEVRFKEGACCCLVLASDGYPAAYQSGFPIRRGDLGDAAVYWAGVAGDGRGGLITAGGRVLGVSVVRETLAQAVADAYAFSENIDFANKYYRHDIGGQALAALDAAAKNISEKNNGLSDLY